MNDENPLYNKADHKRALEIPSSNDYRTEFRRDYARLVHSPAFRRLQGKTQLFPGTESDFFRNRLTHSLEVAQVAKSIALKLNATVPYFQQHKIDTDLVETAALAHDLGHPPFGHNGEYALDTCMRDFGGFEGNAQTLRIVSTVAKKEIRHGNDEPVGLNFTYRTIGSILKYDKVIPIKNSDRGDLKNTLVKGHYKSDAQLVVAAKAAMLNGNPCPEKFKTIECQIMDIADDIAYSTYDLEDAMKAGFVNPLELLSYARKAPFLKKIVKKLKEGADIDVSTKQVHDVYISMFGDFIVEQFKGIELKPTDIEIGERLVESVVNIYDTSKNVASDGQFRTQLTSELVNTFIGGVSVEVNHEIPVLSTIKVEHEIHIMIEVVKHFTFLAMIMSPRLKVVEYRGRDIVTSIFTSLTTDDGYLMLPDDCQAAYEACDDVGKQKRLVCDFIAGMTDRYAIEFYTRLKSVDAGLSFFKPL